MQIEKQKLLTLIENIGKTIESQEGYYNVTQEKLGFTYHENQQPTASSQGQGMVECWATVKNKRKRTEIADGCHCFFSC